MKKSGLGKGLDVLISKPKTEDVSRETLLRISEIEPNREQPRKEFNSDSLDELADSIREHGLIQPVIVVKKEDYYMIVAGERRWRAAKIAGLKKIPAIIKKYDEREIDEIALIENIQREGLNPIEEARGMATLIEKYGLKQEDIAKRISKSRPYIANTLRLLKLPLEIQEFLVNEDLSYGHVRTLISIEDKDKQIELAKVAIKEQLSVRELEELVKKGDSKKKIKSKSTKDNEVVKVEQLLEESLKTRVEIKNSKNNKGKITISYNSLDDFERLVDLLRRK